MATKIVISNEKSEDDVFVDEMQSWLAANAGQGSQRYSGRDGNVSHWLNGDDWLVYREFIPTNDEGIPCMDNLIFIFRSEMVAFEFALRFAQ